MNTTKPAAVTLMLLLLAVSVEAAIVYITFVKQDYTGQWADSTLHVQENVSGGWFDHYNSTWGLAGSAGPAAMTASYDYKIIISQTGSQIDKGIVQFTSNATQNVVITTPVNTYPGTQYDGLTMLTWSNSTLHRVYCYHLVSADKTFTNSSFQVYNTTAYVSQLLYTAWNVNASLKESTFQYEVPNVNHTYGARCTVNYDGRTVSRYNSYLLGNDTERFMGPTTFTTPVGGWSLTDIFRGAGLFIVVFTFGLGSMINASIITLMGVGVLWVMDYWGWLDINPIILGFILVFAVAYRFKQAKVGVG